MAGECFLQRRGKRSDSPRIERFRHQLGIKPFLLRQFPKDIRQAGANRDFTAKQLHAVARARLQRQLIALKTFAYGDHVILQRGAADKPLIRQVFQLE